MGTRGERAEEATSEASLGAACSEPQPPPQKGVSRGKAESWAVESWGRVHVSEHTLYRWGGSGC